MGGGCGTESGGQLDIYTEHRANRTFDILDVGLRERGVKDDFLEFQPEQLNEQQCHFQREEPLVGGGGPRVCTGHIKFELPSRYPSTDAKKANTYKWR